LIHNTQRVEVNKSRTVPAMQECFLRALAAQYIEIKYSDMPATWFSPLRHTLAVLLDIERLTGEASISFIEMALVVQLTSSADNIDDISRHVLEIRVARNEAKSKQNSIVLIIMKWLTG